MRVTKLAVEEFDRWKDSITTLFKEAVIVNFPDNRPNESYYAENIQRLKNYIAENNAIVFLCIDTDSVLGMAWCHSIQRFNERRLHVASIAVMPHCRNMGVGKKLLEEIEGYAGNNSYVGLDLLVTADNTNAVCFYQNNGFETERLLMKKELKNDN